MGAILGSPLGLTDRTDILKLQINRVRLNKNDVAFGFVRLAGTVCVRAGKGLGVWKRGVLKRIGIDGNAGSGTAGTAARAEIGLKNQSIIQICGLEWFLNTTLTTHMCYSAFRALRI